MGAGDPSGADRLTDTDDALRVVVASRNPVKLGAAAAGFERMFPGRAIEVEASDAPSGVADQPWSDAETLTGATNRATGARAERPDAEFWVGIEGGLQEVDGAMESFAWVVVGSSTVTGRSRTASFQLPPAIADLVRSGLELGTAIDQTFDRVNSKQGSGAVGMLTAGAIDRQALYVPAVILALIPHTGPDVDAPGSAGTATTGPSR